MKVLSNTYSLRKDSKLTDTSSVNKLIPTQSFRGGKLKFEQELSKAVHNSIKANSSGLKDIIENPAHRKTFFTTLSAIIVSTATAITQAIHGNNPEEPEETIIKPKKTSDIKFETTRGKCPQIEKDIISFTNEHFKDDSVSADKMKLLFNKFCGKNRNTVYLHEGQAVEGKVLIKTIFEELKANCEDKEQLYAIISKYMSLEHFDRMITPLSTPANIREKGVGIPEPEIKDTKKTEEQLEQIKTVLSEYKTEYNLDDVTIKQVLKNMKKNFSDNLDSISYILQSMDTEEEKKAFLIAMANKTISPKAIENYNQELRNKGLTFLQYNEFQKLNLSDDTIQKLISLVSIKRIKNITAIGEPNSFAVAVPGNYSINNKFQTIREGFEIITSRNTTLSSHEDVDFNKTSLINELKYDFTKNGNHITYKNIIAYLYGTKHKVNSLKDFDKNQYDNKFMTLIALLNNTRIFNNNLFSNHSKLRFIERYVLTEDSAHKHIIMTTKKQIRLFIEALKRELGKGVNINPYSADDEEEIIGIQVRFSDPNLGNVKITLNNQEKMHTII